MKSAAPWWASLVFGAGILLVFAGRIFDSGTGPQLVLAGVGGALLLAMTALRAYAMIRADKPRRGVERSLFLVQLLVLIVLAYQVSYDVPRDARVGLARYEYDEYHSVSGRWRTRADAGIAVLWAAVIAGSLLDRKRRPEPVQQ